MKIHGKKLLLVRDAVAVLLQEINNQIVTCPEPDEPEFAIQLAEYEELRVELVRLQVRIDRSIERESASRTS